eukprot:scaffold119963_cov54-Phaeocystis_antarctica.AAC.2
MTKAPDRLTLGDGTVLVESAFLLGHPTAQLEPPRPMPPPPGLTKADVSNLIELYGNEEGGQARFAVYVGKPGPKAWSWCSNPSPNPHPRPNQ